MPTNLSRITKVNPRDIWKHEALDFKQWIDKEENISILCEELGIEIENIKPEASAGRYNVDIIADEIDSKRKVIIENQLEPTDHKHLGQILTYASAYDAAIIIWIVTDYTEEHRQARQLGTRCYCESSLLVQLLWRRQVRDAGCRLSCCAARSRARGRHACLGRSPD
jgi:hypothetical protein